MYYTIYKNTMHSKQIDETWPYHTVIFAYVKTILSIILNKVDI